MTDDTTTGAFDLATTHIHLGLGATAVPLPGFEWSAEYLAGYDARFAGDGDEGRLVTMGPVDRLVGQLGAAPRRRGGRRCCCRAAST